MRFVAAIVVFASGCSRVEAPARGTSAGGDAPRAPAAAVEETSRKAETSPEIVQRAEQILAEHSDAPVGTEIPFVLNGKRYVGRVEIHDNPNASPGRPPGEHKGITVYVAP